MPRHDETVAEVLAEMRARSFKVHQTLLDDLARIEVACRREVAALEERLKAEQRTWDPSVQEIKEVWNDVY